MSSITFGRNTTSTYGLIVAPYEIPAPPVQTNYVSVPGRDGSLDMSETFGHVIYGDRVIYLTLFAVGDYSTRVSNFLNAVHGARMSIVFDKDSTHYYQGRVEISGIEKRDGYCAISVTITAEPYKYDNSETTVTINGTGRTTLSNGKMPVVPTVVCTAETTLSITVNLHVTTITLSAGTHIVPELALSPNGSLRVNVTSEGKTTFKYRKGWI